MYFIGIRLLGADQVGVGTFSGFLHISEHVLNPIRNLANFYNKLVTNLSAAERIFDILDTPAEIVDREGAKELPPIRGKSGLTM